MSLSLDEAFCQHAKANNIVDENVMNKVEAESAQNNIPKRELLLLQNKISFETYVKILSELQKEKISLDLGEVSKWDDRFLQVVREQNLLSENDVDLDRFVKKAQSLFMSTRELLLVYGMISLDTYKKVFFELQEKYRSVDQVKISSEETLIDALAPSQQEKTNLGVFDVSADTVIDGYMTPASAEDTLVDSATNASPAKYQPKDDPTLDVKSMDDPTLDVKSMDDPTLDAKSMDDPTLDVKSMDDPTLDVEKKTDDTLSMSHRNLMDSSNNEATLDIPDYDDNDATLDIDSKVQANKDFYRTKTQQSNTRMKERFMRDDFPSGIMENIIEEKTRQITLILEDLKKTQSVQMPIPARSGGYFPQIVVFLCLFCLSTVIFLEYTRFSDFNALLQQRDSATKERDSLQAVLLHQQQLLERANNEITEQNQLLQTKINEAISQQKQLLQTEFEQLISQEKLSVDSQKDNLIRIHTQIVDVLQDIGRELTSAKTYNKSNVELMKAMLFELKGNDSSAVQSYQKAIEMNKKNWKAHVFLGELYYQQKKVQDALAQWEYALKIDSSLKNIQQKVASVKKN